MSDKEKTKYRDKLGPIPPEHFDDDFAPAAEGELDESKGSLYERMKERIKQHKPKR